MGTSKRERECAVPRILIVDDDPDIVEAGKLVLEREGFEVEGASSRAEGLARIEQTKPDLLILDVMMEEPDDGLRMAREIRKNGNELPIIMLTSVNAAMGLNIDKDEEMVPVDEFQSKPVEPATLVAKVKDLLAKGAQG
jgi:DNA-binding response OmpR family regulator